MVILAGDHIYKMDYEIMLRQHVDTGADVTIGCLEVPRMEATGFGVMHVDEQRPDHRFRRKARRIRPAFPDKPDMALASMGIYVFETRVPDGAAAPRRRDRRLEPRFRQGHHPLHRQERQGRGRTASHAPACARPTKNVAYWRDVGTVDAYWEANIDLTDVTPELDLYDRDWPIWTYAEITPPAKFVHDDDGRRGSAVNSLVSGDCIVSGGSLDAHAAVHRRRASIPIRELRRGGGAALLRRSAAARG